MKLFTNFRIYLAVMSSKPISYIQLQYHILGVRSNLSVQKCVSTKLLELRITVQILLPVKGIILMFQKIDYVFCQQEYIWIFFPLVTDIKNTVFSFSPVRHLIEIYRVARAYEMCRKFLHSHRQIFQCNELTKSPRAVPYFQCHKRLWGSFNNYVDKIRPGLLGNLLKKFFQPSKCSLLTGSKIQYS